MKTTGECDYSIGIVGAQGRMGSWLHKQLDHCGLNVRGIDRTSAFELGKFAESCDVLVLAIPLRAFHSVTTIVGEKLKPHSLLIDIASLKAEPVHEMLKNSSCEVIGAHPMFGPSAESFRGRLCYICPGRSNLWSSRITDFLLNLGAQVRIISPDDHDRLMAVVQTLRHIIITSLGLTLRDVGFDLSLNAGIAGEWFQKLVDMMGNQFDQPAQLYTDLALSNRYSREVLGSFSKQSSLLVESVLRDDSQTLLNLMNLADEYSKTLGDITSEVP